MGQEKAPEENDIFLHCAGKITFGNDTYFPLIIKSGPSTNQIRIFLKQIWSYKANFIFKFSNQGILAF